MNLFGAGLTGAKGCGSIGHQQFTPRIGKRRNTTEIKNDQPAAHNSSAKAVGSDLPTKVSREPLEVRSA
jgi:hypothetical protein